MTPPGTTETERRLRDALAARADLVEAGQLSRRTADAGPRQRKRWFVVGVATAASVTLLVAAAALVSGSRGDTTFTSGTDQLRTSVAGVTFDLPGGWTVDPLGGVNGVRRVCLTPDSDRAGRACGGIELLVADPAVGPFVDPVNQSGLYWSCRRGAARIWTLQPARVDRAPATINDFHCDEGDPPNWFWYLDNHTLAVLVTDPGLRPVAEDLLDSLQLPQALRDVPSAQSSQPSLSPSPGPG